MTHFRGMEGPALIEVRDWSVWLRFPNKVSQSEVHEVLQEALTELSLWPESEGGESAKWEIRPIWPVEEREER